MAAMMTPRIAVIEDEDGLRREVLDFLGRLGWEVWGAGSAGEFWRHLPVRSADLVMVDLSLPAEDALSVVRQLRQTSERGILALTERASPRERLLGFENGADHCLDKPLELAEMAGAVRALWRRVRNSVPIDAVHRVGGPSHAGWSIDTASKLLAAPDGRSVILSDQEFSLVSALFADPGTVISKPSLLLALYPRDVDGNPHRIEVVLSRARQRAASAGIQLPVRSVFGKGLVFVPVPPPGDQP